MFRNILFDWSGTLCDDLSLTLQATNYVISRYGLPELDRAAFRAEFQLPYPAYYSWKTPGVPIEELEEHYRHILNSPEAVPVTVLPHARAFLDFCKARGIRCFILSSMDSHAFARQSRELGVYDYFEGIHTGILNKEAHIHTLLARHGLRAADTAFIGDMQHDMRAAHAAGSALSACSPATTTPPNCTKRSRISWCRISACCSSSCSAAHPFPRRAIPSPCIP